jgi:hypothetical protein
MTGLAVRTTFQPLPAHRLTFTVPRPAAGVWLAVLILLAGSGLRLAAFAADRSLWIDEAMLALNIQDRTFAGLLEPLAHNQGAPPGFLWACKASTLLFGMNEYALRIPALVASLAAMFAFASAAYQLLPARTTRLALALFAVAPYLVAYSAECKQYTCDAAASCILLALAAGLLNGRTGGWRWWLLALGGAGAVWFSHPSLFVAAAIGLALVQQSLVQGNRQRTLAALLTGAVWLASFALVYFVNLRHLGGNHYLQDYWAGYFLPWPTRPAEAFWIFEKLGQFLAYPGGFAAAAGVPVIVGLIGLRKRNHAVAWGIALVGPCVLVLAASAFRKYPFCGRLLIFLVPALLLLVAAGAVELADMVGRTSRFAAALGLGFLLLGPALETRDMLRHPKHPEELKPVLLGLQSCWQPNDRIYVYNGSGDAGAGPAFAFYAPRYPLPADRIVLGGVHRGQPEGYLNEVRALPKGGRVWLLVSHEHKDEVVRLRAWFESERKPGEAIVYPGSAAYAYDER